MKEKKIEVLTDREHLLLRPSMYLGSIDPIDEKILLLNKDNIITEIQYSYSPAFYRLFDEILDNAIDEFKRCMRKDSNAGPITVEIFEDEQTVKISDNGFGFFCPNEINHKSGLTNVESALTLLRAGSNFYNNDIEDLNVIGTNGIGSAAVNMVSDIFTVNTSDGKGMYIQEWNNFNSVKREYIKGRYSSGTSITFKPLRKLFGMMKYDFNIILSKLALRNLALNYGKEKTDPHYIEINFIWKKTNTVLPEHIFPDYNFSVVNKMNSIMIWESYEGSTTTSMMNNALCSGLQIKIIQDFINELFNYPLADKFYDFFLNFNIPPKLLKFTDQNKTRFSGSRNELEPLLMKTILQQFKREFLKTQLYQDIYDKIQRKIAETEIKKLKISKKNAKVKISNKFLASTERNENIFIVEGNSAFGSISQNRNPKTDAIYSLRGKLRNVRSLSDMINNKEILELMNILGIEYSENKEPRSKFKRIIIATDKDPDGEGHIASLIINFFSRWFPSIVKTGNVHILNVPLMAIENKIGKRYYYSFEEYSKNKNEKDKIYYYKGLGSYSLKDWNYIFNNMELIQIIYDSKTVKILDMAFGTDALKRKKWLEI